MADLTNQFIAQIRDAAVSKQTLYIDGGGSKRWYGNASVAAHALATTGHHGIVEYDPAELVLTARAGTTLSDIESVLAERGQMLAFEPPRYTPESTLGGAIATALSGPGRPYMGGVRDFVLGMHVIDGRGDVLKFGGQVMKNVAGYDVSRLMTGAMGILGVISQVSLKVLPVPPASASQCFEVAEPDAIRWVNEWAGQPLPLTATAWEHGVLTVRLSGARAAVDAAVAQLGGTRLEHTAAMAYWQSLRDQTHRFFCDANEMNAGQTLWRLSLPGVAPAIAQAQLPGANHPLIEWGGAQRWIWSDAAGDVVRSVAQQLGGHAVRFKNQHRDGETFAQPGAALMAVHRRLKQTFDPHGIFNPGRLYLGL
jgi:glycolate oxidase FAD binding subunit